MKILDELKYDAKGLVPAIMQDADTGDVLMVAYMNREAIEKTLETGTAHFWSRSRGKLWLKGESSGHTQSVQDAFIDCDADTLLFKVRQEGGACHAGYRSCFYRRVANGGERAEIIAEKVFDPDEVYGKK